MTIDIARDSFNAKTRNWRAVLAQQGRVTLEADINEQSAIAAEILQQETVDIIGPIGTPDRGYLVSAAGADVQIGSGTIYVGGLRLSLPKAVLTASQPDWLNMAPWPTPSGNQTIGLLVIEQSVCAVEDQTLLEVALGGPDSAGRLALLQHFLRIPTSASNCADAASALKSSLAAQGLEYDPKTCKLKSKMRLQVSVIEPPKAAGPCEPQATGGYLGADNQMIRVAVTSFDSQTNQGELVWSYNNAAFLYRATVVSGDTVALLTTPLDPDHTPQAGQAVELLYCTEDLGDGEPAHSAAGGNFIAAGFGSVLTLGANPFSASNNQLTLPVAFAADGTRPFFIRLWQQILPFTAGVNTKLGDTGLDVIITNPTLPGIGGRPWWHFAVRPSTPQNLYPQRYLNAPQPPEGPIEYLAPLGVVGWNNGAFNLIEDCSLPFLPLTKLHDCSCCALTLDPNTDWLTALNQAINNTAITTLSVCFQPGQFNVPNKITINNKSVRMTGAGYGTQLTGASLEAVLEFDSCPDVSLSDFAVTSDTAGYEFSAGLQNLQGAVTLRSCNEIDIERMKLSCADADLRSASCLYIINPSTPTPTGQTYNARVRDSRFEPGHCQVGILLVNADRAQIEGNVVITPLKSRDITIDNFANYKMTAFRLRKQLLHSLTLTSTAAPTTKKARAKLRKRQAAARATPAANEVALKEADATAAVAALSPATAQRTAQLEAKPASQPATARTKIKYGPVNARDLAKEAAPHVNLGAIGRAQIKISFGTTHVSFLSSAKLTDAWSNALRASPLTTASTIGTIHRTIRALATNIVLKPASAAPAFQAWINETLPNLYSTSSQGIVVGGDFANDVRILNNTIDGTCQGIHVGLSDVKKYGPHPGHLIANRVQIKGNTVNIRLTAETTGDRHGIYLGCVASGLIAENHLELTRYPNAQSAGQFIDAIKIAGFFGQSLIIERNNMLGFTNGIYTAQDATSPPDNVLWIISENASDSLHQITGGNMFITEHNIP
jgi:hypothetical protein